MTEEQLCNLVLEATGKSEKDLPKARIIALSKLALQRLANVIAELDGRPDAQAMRQLIRVDKTVSITSGVGDLTALKTAAEPILADEIYSSEVYFSGIARRGQSLPDRSSLALDRLPGFPYFTVTGDEIAVRYNGTNPTCTATIRGPIVRSLANIPSQLNDNFVSIVAFLTTPEGMAVLEKAAVSE